MANKTPILFVPKVSKPGTHQFFRDYLNAEQYGIEVRNLTPRHDKHGYGFSIRSAGQRLRGYVSSAGDCIVRLGHTPSQGQHRA
jgi:hypothetical protein